VNLAGESLPEWLFQLISAIIVLGGTWLAYVYYYKKKTLPALFQREQVNEFFYKGWGFDQLYDRLIVRPVEWLSSVNKNDVPDKFFTYIARSAVFFNGILSKSQNGRLRLYAVVLTAGLVILLTLMLAI